MLYALVGTAGEGIWVENEKDGLPIKRASGGGVDVFNKKNKLIEFLGAFNRIQNPDRMGGYVDSKPFVAEERHKEAMRILNDGLRNRFIHYSPVGWGIEDEYIYEQCLPIIEIANFLVMDSRMCIFDTEETERLVHILEEISESINLKIKENHMQDIYSESVELHRKNKGKLEIRSKVPVTDRGELSLAYSPGVAGVCREIAADKDKSFELTFRGNAVAVVSDGSAILGLGNLGPEAALPVMEGKAILFKKFGGVDAFPVCLDTQDTEEIIRTVKLLAPNFAGINLEDISAPRCFEVEERLKAELSIPVMHDDQHGTAVVVLAGLINALRLRGAAKEDAKIIVNGAGAAGIATAKLLLKYGFKDIIMADSKGIVCEGRDCMNPSKDEMAKITNPEKITGDLAQAVKGADIFIGMSAPDVLKGEMVRTMNEKPIIFALANPVPEIMPDKAKEAGAYIVASGRSDFPNQVNNVLAFPGIFRGALDHKVKQITDEMLVRAAEAIADCVENPTPEQIIPDPFDREVPQRVADAIR